MAANLQAQIGPTYGDYVKMLTDNAAYLGRLGETVTDIGQLFSFEVQQAIGLTPVGTLAAATDASVPTPGLALSFGRSFGNTITDRYQTGPFGRGWASDWQLSLEKRSDGTVVVRASADSQRRFTPDTRGDKTGFFSQPGDAGMMRMVNGGFELTESNGQVTRFRADGTLEYVQNANGNRITAGFANGKLVRLTYTNVTGTNLSPAAQAFIAIEYNAAGLVSRLTDSLGRVTTYGHDTSNTYLLSVTGPGGTTSYSYSTAGTPAQQHALTSVTDPSGAARFFAYDARGRLTETFLSGTAADPDNKAEVVKYAYDTAGEVTATDAGGGATSLFFDHRGLVVRTEDGTGAYVRYEYGDDRHLSRETDALGRSRSYTWCGCGSLLTVTDEYGNVSRFAKGGPNDQPLSFTDANGNKTFYGYDDKGDLTSTTYADGSVEKVAYDATGNPTQLVNRRGQAITRTFNAAGQLTGETFPDGPPTTYTYDARGRLATAADGSGTTVFSYDAADRLIRVDYPSNRWLRYEYDAAGRRTRMEDETGFVPAYSYDAAGRLSELRDGAGALVVWYTYDAAGRLLSGGQGERDLHGVRLRPGRAGAVDLQLRPGRGGELEVRVQLRRGRQPGRRGDGRRDVDLRVRPERAAHPGGVRVRQPGAPGPVSELRVRRGREPGADGAERGDDGVHDERPEPVRDGRLDRVPVRRGRQLNHEE